MSDEERSDLVTPKEFARSARVADSTVERWRFMGHGPRPIYLGPGRRTVRYNRSDVERFLVEGDDS